MQLECHRIIYFTDKIEAMSRFYAEVIGLSPVVGGDGEWRAFDAGACQIALHRGRPSPGARGPKIVFHSADVAASRATLIQRGAADLGRVVSGDQVTFCDGRDPDGNPFQISTRHR